jgi:hypothetical protein
MLLWQNVGVEIGVDPLERRDRQPVPVAELSIAVVRPNRWLVGAGVYGWLT